MAGAEGVVADGQGGRLRHVNGRKRRNAGALTRKIVDDLERHCCLVQGCEKICTSPSRDGPADSGGHAGSGDELIVNICVPCNLNKSENRSVGRCWMKSFHMGLQAT